MKCRGWLVLSATCIHVYMCACIHLYWYICMHLYMYTCIHVHMYTGIHVNRRSNAVAVEYYVVGAVQNALDD